MDYTFCVYEKKDKSKEVHILDYRGEALCRGIDSSKCKEIDICVDFLDILKSLKNLSKCEAIAVAHSLQVLSGVNICGRCVASLYRNE